MKAKSILFLFVFAITAMISCTKDADESAGISEASLSSMATSQEGLMLMRTTDMTNGKWHIKMNDIAAKAYSEGSKDFPLNSMIVKTRFDHSGSVEGYDVMYRTESDPNSSNGWVWNSLTSDGEVIYNESELGASCQSCHGHEELK